MLEPRKLLDDLLGAQVPGTQKTVGDTANDAVRLAKENPIAAGGIALALLGTSPGRAIAGAVLRMGGLAAIAGLAYKAFQQYRHGGSAGTDDSDAAQMEILPPPDGSAFDPRTAPQGEDEFALAVIRAMIAAANADGHIDEEERARISARLEQAGIGQGDGRLLEEELASPADIDAIVASARSDAQKVELYTASRIALAPRSAAERNYLEALASRLGLSEALVEQIESTVLAANQ